jgi:hypothetical protein
LQFVYLGFDVSGQVPTHEEARAGRELVASIAATPGEVLMPYHSYLVLMAGKEPSAHQVTLWELSGKFSRPDTAVWTPLENEISTTLRSKQYERIGLDHLDNIWENVPLYYVDTGERYMVPAAYNPRGEPRPLRTLDFRPK